MMVRVRSHFALAAAAALAACSGKGDGGPHASLRIAVTPLTAALCIGDSLTFAAQVLDTAGHVVAGSPIRWTSSAPTMVSVDSVSGVARALAFGTAQINASAGALRSATPGRLDVPADLSPEFVPDTVVLAPLDTFTLGARMRRLSAGPAPSRTPVMAPSKNAVASLDATGLVTAKAPGTASLTLAGCGFTGHGAARVFTPADSLTGVGYLWVSPPAELHLSLPAMLYNFRTTAGLPAFQVFSLVGPASSPTRVFVSEYTATLSDTGTFRIDSLLSSEATTAPCAPRRPFATYSEPPTLTALFSLSGGTTVVTTFASKGNYAIVSGRATLRMRGIVGGVTTQLDTVTAIYTFGAPLVTKTNACP